MGTEEEDDVVSKEPLMRISQESAPSMTMVVEGTDHGEALHFKTLAEKNYTDNLKSALDYAQRAHELDPSLEGLQEMLIAFKILVMAESPWSSSPECSFGVLPDYYRIMELERFSHINTIKKQFKKMALILHPDKNPSVASEEAFKLVGEATMVLSDKIRKNDYDMKLRIVMQSQAEKMVEFNTDTFSTTCSNCRLLHRFERKYLEHNLMCPKCKKFFKATEVEENDPRNREGVEDVPTRASARIKEQIARGKKFGILEKFDLGVKSRSASVGVSLDKAEMKIVRKNCVNGGAIKGLRSKRVEDICDIAVSDCGSIKVLSSNKVGKDAEVDESRCTSTQAGDVVYKSRLRKRIENKEADTCFYDSERTKRAKVCEEEEEEESMTLAQMQVLARQKKVKDTKRHSENVKLKRKKVGKKTLSAREKMDECGDLQDDCLEVAKGRTLANNKGTETEMPPSSKNDDAVILRVEDSDFHDFDSDRRERSFKKGQIWAAYDDDDDDDAMPRHYALIDDVSVNPFLVTLNWLEFQCNGDEESMQRQKTGPPSSCGKFKLSRKVSVKYPNLFSHLVDNERIARDIYVIYPKKGTIWAVYHGNPSNSEIINERPQDKRSYNIILSLNSYSDTYGMSIAFLDKVHGFRTIYKRRDVGANAVNFLEKDDIKLFSHQIPAKKLSGEEASNLPNDSWELDPASIPP